MAVDPRDPSVRSVPPPPPRAPRTRNRAALGALVFVIGLLGVPLCIVAAVLTANPCGTFGDACADYGQASSISVAFAYGIVASALLATVGFVVMVVSWIARPRPSVDADGTNATPRAS